ncbi:MAG: alpha-ketoglutarate-dependent dioxygenase AlkB [Ferruginibacter sp.]|nr:alpha-ketoglutarate-dependent dioxygenase AlkB [Ferruginibacter sp.]
MNLFENTSSINLLPSNGTVNYFGKIFSTAEANHFTKILLNTIAWKNDEAIIFGKRIITKRKVAWYANKPFAYTYSNTTKYALPFTKELIELKNIVEEITKAKYNACLLNLYHNGNEAMAWHSDNEKELAKNGTIASLSFGAERKFMFKHKTEGNTVSVLLENGSLLTMKDDTQTNWLHRLTTSTKIKTPRVNLTFRMMNK